MSLLSPHQFAAAVAPLRPALLRYAAQHLAPSEADDLVSDAILQCLSCLDRYDPDAGQAGLFRFVLRPLRLLCRERRRARMEAGEILLAPDELTRLVELRQEMDAPQMSLSELRSRIRRAELTARQRDCFEAALEGETQAAIGARLGVSQQCISYHIAEAINRIRAVEADDISPAFERLFADLCRVTIYRKPKRPWRRPSTQRAARRKTRAPACKGDALASTSASAEEER